MPIQDSRYPILSTAKLRSNRRNRLTDMLATIGRIETKRQIDVTWVVLDNMLNIYLADRLIGRREGTEVVVTTNDHPDYFALNRHVSPRAATETVDTFSRVMLAADRVSVSGEDTRATYQEWFGRDTIPIYYMPDSVRATNTNVTRQSSRGGVSLGFAGSLYAKHEWNALMRAVTRYNGRSPSRRISVSFIGRFPLRVASRPSAVRANGLIAPDAVHGRLRGLDVAYLPYRLDSSWDRIAQTSFPAKLGSYLLAGLPVLGHSPATSTICRFTNRHPVGLNVSTMESEDLMDSLFRLVDDSDLLRSIDKHRKIVLATELTRENMYSGFRELVGASA